MTESATKVDDSMFGGNASAEGGAEEAAVDGPDKSGCNIVLANRLQGTTYTKKDYQTHIKVLYRSYCLVVQAIHTCTCTYIRALRVWECAVVAEQELCITAASTQFLPLYFMPYTI